jgi:hypothetical protein
VGVCVLQVGAVGADRVGDVRLVGELVGSLCGLREDRSAVHGRPERHRSVEAGGRSGRTLDSAVAGIIVSRQT